MAVGNVGMDVPIKFGDSMSNGFPDIRGADFVSNERTLAEAYPNSAKYNAFRLEMVLAKLLCHSLLMFYLLLGDGCEASRKCQESLPPIS